MIPPSPLLTALLDLHAELLTSQIPLMLGGGYGLYLRQLQLQSDAHSTKTLLPGELWPLPRTTEDIDLFLSTEIIADGLQMRSLRETLDRLHYHVLHSAKFFQFVKAIPPHGQVKIDLLTGPILNDRLRHKIHRSLPRVRSREPVELHAYLTEEALDLFESPTPIEIHGTLSSGFPHNAVIHVPAPFPFLLMKLHALADRLHDADKDLGRHHALDIYRIVALLTEPEYHRTIEQSARHRSHRATLRAATIVHELFAAETSPGSLRLREHHLYSPNFDHRTLTSVLTEIFPKRD